MPMVFFFEKWLRNHPQFLLHFLIHIDVLMLCRKFEPIPTEIFRVMAILKYVNSLRIPCTIAHGSPLFVSRMVECIHCRRSFHKICVLYHDDIWPEGYQCCNCLQRLRTTRKDNRFIAKSKYMYNIHVCTVRVYERMRSVYHKMYMYMHTRLYKTIHVHAVHVHI